MYSGYLRYVRRFQLSLCLSFLSPFCQSYSHPTQSPPVNTSQSVPNTTDPTPQSPPTVTPHPHQCPVVCPHPYVPCPTHSPHPSVPVSLFFSPAHPMCPWNRDALVSLREKLQLRVLMETGLCNRLEEAAGGFMNRFEAVTVREQSGNIEQMGKVIDILCGKGDKDFSTFLQMLRGSNNEVWAEKLERKAEELKREKGVCAERKEATQRDSAQCL